MERYYALKSNCTKPPVLFIDTHATSKCINYCAQQRLKTVANLLETLTCLSFRHSDTKDTEHVISAIHLLVQDTSDLLEVAQLQAEPRE
ncbi:hypothetical protein ACXM5X_01735 [Pseudomonas saponiphila]